MRITRLPAPRCQGGEAPMWDAETRQLFYIDNSGRKVHAFDPETGLSRTLAMPGLITSLVMRERGGAVVTLRSGVHLLDLDSGALEPLSPLPDPPPVIFNDAKADRRGRVIIGAGAASNFSDPAPVGGIYRLDTRGELVRLMAGVHLSNGPCWSPDGATFHFSDSWLRRIYAFDYDADTGAIANRRDFADTTALGGMPDGATVDAEGLYWTAIYQGGAIAAFRPDGTLERTIAMPVPLVSSVMFGGAHFDRLFVTTIAHDRQAGADDDAGSLFVIDGLGAVDLPEYRWAG